MIMIERCPVRGKNALPIFRVYGDENGFIWLTEVHSLRDAALVARYLSCEHMPEADQREALDIMKEADERDRLFKGGVINAEN